MTRWSRLSTLTNNLGGSATTHDLAQTFGYNPASQIANMTRSNDAYAWQAHYNVDRSYVADGLNRIMSAGGLGGYDARGNLTSDGTNAYTYGGGICSRRAPAARRWLMIRSAGSMKRSSRRSLRGSSMTAST